MSLLSISRIQLQRGTFGPPSFAVLLGYLQCRKLVVQRNELPHVFNSFNCLALLNGIDQA